MDTRSTDAIPLAPRPDLEQYRKLAKGLLKAARTGDPANIRAWAAAWIERLAKLQDQTATPEYVVPGSPGELNWKHINNEVDGIIKDTSQSRLLHSSAGPADVSLSEAQLVVARLHGFESWPKFVKHVEALTESSSPVSQFEAAADAIVTGDVTTLRALIGRNRRLARARSTRDHQATLLHYIAANGHEGFRQRTPTNAVEIAGVLLDAGADPDAHAQMYGYATTTMEMLVSSVHPHAAGVQSALVEILLDFGAAVDGVDNDASPLMTAISFHYPKAAETLARRGATIDNVIAAAAVGPVDLIDRFINEDGTLRPEVPLHDGPWPKLANDPKVHLGYALTYACTFGRNDVVELLLKKGVDPSGTDGEQSALHYAAGRGRMSLVRLLLEYGASLETRNRYDGTVLDGTLWYAYNAPVRGVDYPAVVRELVDLGARTDLYPEMQGYVDGVLAGTSAADHG